MTMDPRTLRAFADELQKIAGAKQFLQRPDVFLPALGAAVLGTAQYLANRAPAGGKSPQQKAFSRAEAVTAMNEKERKKEGREPTLVEDVDRVTAKPMRQLADIAAKHPVKSAIPSAAVGALIGRGVARVL